MTRSWSRAAVCALSLAVPSRAAASKAEGCAAEITRNNLVACALAGSPNLRAQREATGALAGRRTTASSILPSNPVLAVTAARRSAPGTDRGAAFNWSASLSQELEIGGQRASRQGAAEADLQAQRLRLLALQRDTAAAAWSAFFELLGARSEAQLAGRLRQAAERVAAAARARADRGLIATVDADVASAATLHALQRELAAQQAGASALARFAFLLGQDATVPGPAVAGELTPLRSLPESVLAPPDAYAQRPELRAFDAERTTLIERARALRRARVPNPTLSVFAQQDGYGERVYGIGLSLPIPLPSPVGRTQAGEIAELEAAARQVEAEKAGAQVQAGLELTRVTASYLAHRHAAQAFEPGLLERAERSLAELGRELEAGRLNVRDALQTQQALVELLLAHLAEREALCLASVALARALDLPLEAGLQ
jgi:cobalt-zinc-cadmium efflux system outer membrane protein